MLAVYKKEMRSYFSSVIGYAFMAFLLLVIGIIFSWINIRNKSPYIGYALSNTNVMVPFMVLIPVITMRILAEESKQRTDQLLYTSPVTVAQIVIAKYLAVVSLFTIPMLVVCLYPTVLASYGTVPYAMSYSAILGFWLLGLAYLAIGVFVSATTENQIIAAVVTFALLLLSFLMTSINQLIPAGKETSLVIFIVLSLILGAVYYILTRHLLGGVVCGGLLLGATIVTYLVKSSLFKNGIQKVLSSFSLYDRMEDFTNGILDLSAIVYYLTVVVFFLILAIQVIEKKKVS